MPVALAIDPGPIRVDGDPSTEEPPLEVVVGLGATLRGRLMGLAQHELPRVRITAVGETAVYDRSRIEVDAAGTFEIPRLSVGAWRIAAALSGTGRRATGEVRVQPGDRQLALELDFALGHRLAGEIVAGVDAVPSLRITLVDGYGLETGTRTDFQGRFLFTGLPSGPTRILLHLEGARPIEVPLDLRSDQDLVLDLLDGNPSDSGSAEPNGVDPGE